MKKDNKIHDLLTLAVVFTLPTFSLSCGCVCVCVAHLFVVVHVKNNIIFVQNYYYINYTCVVTSLCTPKYTEKFKRYLILFSDTSLVFVRFSVSLHFTPE